MMGFLMVGGVHVNPKITAYLRAGYGINKLKVRLSDFPDGEVDTQFNKKLKGFCLGGGISYLLSTKLEIGADYIYHAISAISIIKNNDVLNGKKRGLNLKVPYHYGGIRLTYNF
jgi:opacity protein-like surface antigen